MLVAADPYRPAAVDQLRDPRQEPRHPGLPRAPAARRCSTSRRGGIAEARAAGRDVVILDTAGRLTVDEVLMAEIRDLAAALQPSETLLVVDAMVGQESVAVAEAFGEAVPVTGLVLTKVDGDARGGAALSIGAVTGLPVKFLGTGERTDALEPFHPDRLAGRILGMGDVLTLVERAQENFDEKQAEELARQAARNAFTLEDFLDADAAAQEDGPDRSSCSSSSRAWVARPRRRSRPSTAAI